jgi:DNA-directed RNA polymerase specialized sigma subunit
LVSATSRISINIYRNPSLSQEEIGMKLGINQAAVSKRQKRAQFHLVMEMERYFRNKIKTINT